VVKDLKIGNWVLDAGCNPFRVTDESETAHDGIKLNHDLLEKNGFKTLNGFQYYGYGICVTRKGGSYFFKKDIQFLHELQNLVEFKVKL
jgi:hypothetical protein